MSFSDVLKLNLPQNSYAIFGSGPMGVRGIRNSNDIDIIVNDDLWSKLCIENILDKKSEKIVLGGIEIFNKWMNLTNKIDEMIGDCDNIDNLPFVKLKYVVDWKKEMGREKDKKDIELINNYWGTQYEEYLGKEVSVIIDRPIGAKHPKHDSIYPINYGYIPNTVAPDGEGVDVYVFDVEIPIESYNGRCIAIVHRLDDMDDKLIVSKTKNMYNIDHIREIVDFQEKYYKSVIISL